MSSPEGYYDYNTDQVVYYDISDLDDGDSSDVDYDPMAHSFPSDVLQVQQALAWARGDPGNSKGKPEKKLPEMDTPDLTQMYEGADVILSVEGRQLFCNKQLLCLSSPVLEAAVANTTDWNDGLVEVKLADRDFEEMFWLLRWITPTIRNPLLMDWAYSTGR